MGLQMTLKGGTVLYQPQFNPVTFLETVQKYHISVIQLTSTLAKVLLSTPDLTSTICPASGYATLPARCCPRNWQTFLYTGWASGSST